MFRQAFSIVYTPGWLNDMVFPAGVHCTLRSHSVLSRRLVWPRVAAEIQGDRKDLCQHRVQVL